MCSDRRALVKNSPFELKQTLVDRAKNLYNSGDLLLLENILLHADKLYKDLESSSYQDTGLRMSIVLLENQADMISVSAALLYPMFDDDLLSESLLENIDPSIISVMEGVRQMSVMRRLQNSKTKDNQVENYRKMLLSIIRDVRIVLVKLSERICLLRSCINKESQDIYSVEVAREIVDIYAPLANRLGLFEIKKELEDKSLYILEPQQYKNIQKNLHLKWNKRAIELNEFVKRVKVELVSNGITESVVSGRVKNIYSIWKKMRKKSYELHQLFDISAVRVLVDTVAQCYKALSVIQHGWSVLSSEYSDYIANPKPNGYKSIHTIVLGKHQTAIEVQIRTFGMHEESEHGVAAHWRYKEGVRQDKSYESRIIWLKLLLDWQESVRDENNQLPLVDENILDSRVYAFTPNGDVIDMPVGSTVLDFAYNIHTMVGHRCKGAKLNGKIVTLKQKVLTGDQVEIITGTDPQPSKDWMNVKSGYISSSKIRSRIARWFKSRYKSEYAKLGKEKLLSQCPELDIKAIDFVNVAKHFNLQSQESFFSAIYLGDIKLNQVVNFITQANKSYKNDDVFDEKSNIDLSKFKKQSIVIIHGVDGLLSNIAKCCNPVLGDNISGYVTKDKGVSIHRDSCKNFLRMKKEVPERVIEVQWGKENTTKFIVDIAIKYHLDKMVLKSISSLLSSQDISLISMKRKDEDDVVIAIFSIAVTDLNEIVTLLPKIKSIKNVERVYRL